MAKKFFQPKIQKKLTNKNVFAVTLSVALLCLIFFVTTFTNNTSTITGKIIYEPTQNIKPSSTIKPFIAEEKTDEGLVIKYSYIKQGRVEIGLPVKWEQDIFIENPNKKQIKNFVVSLYVPNDAKNVQIIKNNKPISSNSMAIIPLIKSNSTINLTLKFETSPIWVEFIDDNRGTRVRFWHNSSMIYRNVPIEMNLKLGEKIVELIDGAEKDIVLDYSAGKAKWIIDRI